MRRLMVLVLLALGACGGSDGGSSNLGKDSTLRDVCEAFGDVACDKANECDEDVPANCVDTFVSACCSGGGCSQKIGEDAANAIEACLDDVRDLTCTELQGEDISLANCDLGE